MVAELVESSLALRYLGLQGSRTSLTVSFWTHAGPQCFSPVLLRGEGGLCAGDSGFPALSMEDVAWFITCRLFFLGHGEGTTGMVSLIHASFSFWHRRALYRSVRRPLSLCPSSSRRHLLRSGVCGRSLGCHKCPIAGKFQSSEFVVGIAGVVRCDLGSCMLQAVDGALWLEWYFSG